MLRRQFLVFLIVGCLTVLVDYSSYRFFLEIGLTQIDIAKTGSFITGTIFAYFANHFWTFSRAAPIKYSIWRFFLLYGLTLLVNVSVNSFALKFFTINISLQYSYLITLAFLIATGISATLNFLGMKFWVFKY